MKTPWGNPMKTTKAFAKETEQKRGRPVEYDKEPKEIIDFCLNCTQPYCEGNCYQLQNFIKEYRANAKREKAKE